MLFRSDLTNRIVYYESSRGCPFSCSYCLSCVDKNIRFRSIESVCQELQYFLDRKVPQIKFVDRTFNCRKSHALSILTYIRDHDNGITNFHFEVAADLLTDDYYSVIQTLRPGQIQFEIGVQTTNQSTLEAIHRKTDITLLTKAIGIIHHAIAFKLYSKTTKTILLRLQMHCNHCSYCL